MSEARERAFQSAADEFGLFLRGIYDDVVPQLKAKPESPIEDALFVALLGAGMATRWFRFLDPDPYPKTRRWANVKLQEKIGDYRADFLIEQYLEDDLVGRIVVECDGHEFHERTKEQAERDKVRDRWFTLNGFVVLRFTGREIYRDAARCTYDIMNCCLSLTEKAEAEK